MRPVDDPLYCLGRIRQKAGVEPLELKKRFVLGSGKDGSVRRKKVAYSI